MCRYKQAAKLLSRSFFLNSQIHSQKNNLQKKLIEMGRWAFHVLPLRTVIILWPSIVILKLKVICQLTQRTLCSHIKTRIIIQKLLLFSYCYYSLIDLFPQIKCRTAVGNRKRVVYMEAFLTLYYFCRLGFFSKSSQQLITMLIAVVNFEWLLMSDYNYYSIMLSSSRSEENWSSIRTRNCVDLQLLSCSYWKYPFLEFPSVL